MNGKTFALRKDPEPVIKPEIIKCIRNEYPEIHVTVIVRGKKVLNDATMEDARMVGLTEIADVIDNGTGLLGFLEKLKLGYRSQAPKLLNMQLRVVKTN